MTTYPFSNAIEMELLRLRAMESAYDPSTHRAIEACEPQRGWQCLEVGAGAGSVAQWLCDRVGTEGRVVATDIDTRWLEEVTRSNLEVRSHDLTSEPLEPNTYDLVHARLLLEHLPDAAEQVRRLSHALKPGGWLVVEDLDWASAVPDGDWPAFAAVRDGCARLMAAGGYDPEAGRKLRGHLAAAGLVDLYTMLAAEGTRERNRLGWRFTVLQFRDRLIEMNLVPESTVEQFLADLEESEHTSLPPVMVSVRGRRQG